MWKSAPTAATVAAMFLSAGVDPPAPSESSGSMPAASNPAEPSAPHAPSNEPASPKSLVSFPHPLISEVLYAVPTSGGDANGDGTRQVAGDEFIELINPHDKPIQLKGYKLNDRNPLAKGQLRFVFPTVELPPGGVVVVFNGHECKWKGPVGDSKAPPDSANERFYNALVFTFKSDTQRTSWANQGDYVLLSDPAGEPIHCVYWGTVEETIPEAAKVEEAPLVFKSSIQRQHFGGEFFEHAALHDEPFSPGKPPEPAPKPRAAPAPEGSTGPTRAPAAEPTTPVPSESPARPDPSASPASK
ncbi:MAG: lamin tail domain-containing protein [Phycisphaerales bacterium]|nr:lamin tail domain-containing protein [Phycisphaerales bacterium]